MATDGPSGWSTRTLFELADYQNGIAFRPTDTRGDGLPIIKIAELNGGIGPSTGRAKGEVDARKVIHSGDLLFAWSGSVGVYRWSGPEAVLNQHIFKVTSRNGVDQRFLQYLLESQLPTFQRLVDDQATTMGHVKVSDLKRLKVLVPPLPEQRAIASILGSLDDKIELNRRMNQTLEEIARALFKFWFVDFGPVRAKAEGRWKKGESLPGMPADMWDLWPSEFEDSEIGGIPKGWGVMTLESLCSSITNGGTPRRAESKYWESGHIPWFKTGELRDGPLIDSEEHISEDGLRDSACRLWKRDTVLIALYASPTVGRLGLLKTEATANQACSALSARPEVGYAFLFQTLLCARDGLIQVAVGSAQQNISQEVIRNYPVLAPPPEFTSEFQARTAPLYDAMTMGLRQSAVLSLLRDALLPKLLSGEIRVRLDGGQ